jgi:hypothetical protein
MSRELICSILGIRPDSWPPDHYALIGLSPHEANPARVEIRVQELSAKLRSYQLAHPDDVTDALNRLAQALVCLTDPAARADYDSKRSVGNDSATYNVVPATPTLAPTVTRLTVPETVEEGQRAAQRSIYRRLAAARQLRSAWADLERWFGGSSVRISTLVDAADMIGAAWAVRDALAADAVSKRSEGAIVAALVREPHVLRLFRRLTSHQRADLALDWRRGLAAIDRELQILRDRVRRRRAIPRRFVIAARWLVGDGLDLTLFVLGALALAIAWWRSQH